MKQKGIIKQTHKTIKLDNELLEYWEATKNKNRMVNNAIKELRDREEVKYEKERI